jgi:hypothetical protein
VYAVAERSRGVKVVNLIVVRVSGKEPHDKLLSCFFEQKFADHCDLSTAEADGHFSS